MKRLKNQIAIVFGATGLIGSAVAKLLAENGAKVMVHYHRNAGKAEALLNAIRKRGAVCEMFKADIRNPFELRELVDATIRLLGGLHIIVSSVHPSSEAKSVYLMEWTDWKPHIDAIQGHFQICKTVLPEMQKHRYGRIVFISGGLSKRFLPGFSAYSSVKAGLNSFCKTLALEEGGNNITVNIVAPGKVTQDSSERSTDEIEDVDDLSGLNVNQVPLQRFANTSDVATSVLYFSSPEASGITGQTLFVAGGEIMP